MSAQILFNGKISLETSSSGLSLRHLLNEVCHSYQFKTEPNVTPLYRIVGKVNRSFHLFAVRNHCIPVTNVFMKIVKHV